MHRNPSRSVSSRSGRLTPSMPTKYLASITEIHGRFTLNWRAFPAPAAPNAPGAPASNPNRMATPTARGRPVNRMPRPRVSRSRSPGTSATTSAPSAGRNTASVIAQSSKLIVPPSDPGVDNGEDGHAREEDDRVPLHVPRLDVPDQPVEDPLVRPVDEPGDRILDRTNDPP